MPDQEESKLKVITTEPDKALIGHIENLLNQAKSGSLQGLVYVGQWDDNRTSSSWCLREAFDRNRVSVILGEIEMLKLNLGLSEEGFYRVLINMVNEEN